MKDSLILAFLVCGLGSFASDGAALAGVCRVFDQDLQRTPEEVNDKYARVIGLGRATEVFEFVRSREEYLQGTVAVYAVPERDHRYVVREVGGREPVGLKGGLRFLLVSHEDDGFQVLGHTGHVGETWVLEPRFFKCPDRVVVLAQRASEMTYGLTIYAIQDDTIETLGPVDITPPMTAPASLVSRARPTETEDGLVINVFMDVYYMTPEADGPLLWDRWEGLLSFAPFPIRFLERGGRFELIPTTARPRFDR